MKHSLSSSSISAFLLCCILVVTSCKKDTATQNFPVQNAPIQNKPPVAKAGDDRSITLSCNSSNPSNTFELDGGSSYDPDGNILNYTWIALSAPQGYSIKSPNNKKTLIENASSGKYHFELTVKDAEGLFSKDSVIITVINMNSTEYDLDITFNTTYIFVDNVSDPWNYPSSSSDYDLTEIRGKANFSPLGEFFIYVNEYADTATLSDKIYGNHFQINMGNNRVSGFSSINFKKIIRQGGGPFSGTFPVTDGSAIRCNPGIFSFLPPLQVSGS